MIHDYLGLTVWRIETVKSYTDSLLGFMAFELPNSSVDSEHTCCLVSLVQTNKML